MSYRFERIINVSWLGRTLIFVGAFGGAFCMVLVAIGWATGQNPPFLLYVVGTIVLGVCLVLKVIARPSIQNGGG